MQISSVGLYIKLSLEDIKSLLKLGEKIDVKIVEKLDSRNYMVQVKNKVLRAYSSVEFQQNDKATLIVEKMKPAVILKLIENKPKEFIKTNKIAIDIKKLDMKHKIDSKEMQMQNIIKNETDTIKENIKNAVLMFKDTVQTIKNEQQQNNFFIQVPIKVQDEKEDKIYLREEQKSNKTTDKKKGIRVVLYASPRQLGDIKIDMLYTDNHIKCMLLCSDKHAENILKNSIDEIKKLLGENVSVGVDLLKEKAAFFKKQIDLKA